MTETTVTVTETATPATLDAQRPSAYSALDALDAAIAAAVRAAEERGYQRGLAERPANRPAGLAGLADRLDAIADRLARLDVGDVDLDGLEIESTGDSVEVPCDDYGLSEIASWIDEHGGKTLIDADDVSIDSSSAQRALREIEESIESAVAVLSDLIRETRAAGA